MNVHLDFLDHGIAAITLADGKVNVLSAALLDELAATLDSLESSPVRVIILRAATGARVFSAGHDVRELPTDSRDPLPSGHPLRQVIRKIECSSHPVIAMVEGTVWGGACELILTCDLVIAAEDSTFAFTPARLGVPYDVEGIANLLGIVGTHLLREMVFTADPISATRLGSCGAINRVVPRLDLEAVTREVAAKIAKTSPLVQRLLKQQVRALICEKPPTPGTLERLEALRRDVYWSDDYQEGIRAFLEKRPPDFHGA